MNRKITQLYLDVATYGLVLLTAVVLACVAIAALSFLMPDLPACPDGQERVGLDTTCRDIVYINTPKKEVK